MSFILDALKKSENARQRQIGPAMAELPRRRRQSERPIWAFVVAGLLLVNIGVLVLVLTRKKGSDVQPVAAATAAPVPNNVAMQQPQVQAQPQQVPVQSNVIPQARQAIPEPQPLPVQAPPVEANTAMISSLAAESGMRNDFDTSVSEADLKMLQAVQRAQEQIELEARQAAVTRPIQAPTVAPLPAGGSAVAPSAGRIIGGNNGQAAAVARNATPATGQEEVLPTVDELTASGRTFPPMRLDIHSFADNPAERFVFVNMRRYNEGQTLQEGPAVERITTEGVVLNQQGLRFLLPRP